MSIPDKDIFEKVIQWFEYAEEDLRLARHGLIMPSSCPYRLIAYHAQQCAEKYLKAYLVYHNVDFPYTHNIKKLLKLCEKYAGWAEKLKVAEKLSPYAITARYPGIGEEVTKDGAKQAIALASKVRDVVRKALAKEGMSIPKDTLK